MHTPAQPRPFETVMALIRITTIVLAVYWAALFAATHLPARSLPSMGSDKFYHIVAFSGLGFLLSWATSWLVRGAGLHVSLVVAVAALYALFDEWSQQFVAGRTPDAADFVADMCGTVLGLACFMIVRAVLTREAPLAKDVS